ncbi:MAG: 3-deoxy-manno-octulosonate cytidylyltransferase [Spirochaetia bacterium]|nr:3-deoxy-manno-octulosonate cytidylyltransferase [Spirochaetia bacterium]
MEKILGVIPARYSSERFPGKVIADLCGKPMIQWVYESAKKCEILSKVVIAVDDQKVFDAVKEFGGECIMTSSSHKSGTDRLVEAASHYPDFDIYINIQGDEPGIEPELIEGVGRILIENSQWHAATAARPFHSDEDRTVPDRVKVVLSKKGKALYFSRSLIPYPRKQTEQDVYLHLGIYAYRKNFLLNFNSLPLSGLEDTESLEQLRILENDYDMGVYVAEDSLPGVDTKKDLENMIERFHSRRIL